MQTLEEQNLKAHASLYVNDPELDRLEQLQQSNPAEFQRLPATEKIRLGHYLTQKSAYLRLNPKPKI